MLDISKLRFRIQDLTNDSLHLKSQLRVAWTRPMAGEQQRLVRVRRELTDLFVLLAFSAKGKKKLHVRTAPRHFVGEWDAAAYHQKIAMRLIPDYSIGAETGAQVPA